jgi:hypothetical protein
MSQTELEKLIEENERLAAELARTKQQQIKDKAAERSAYIHRLKLGDPEDIIL